MRGICKFLCAVLRALTGSVLFLTRQMGLPVAQGAHDAPGDHLACAIPQ